MENRFRSARRSILVCLPVIGVAALLMLGQRMVAHFADARADAPVQTLHVHHQGTGELPVDEEDVTITKTADVEAVRVGNTVQYDIIITNNADITVTVDVTDVLPAELRLLNILSGTASVPPGDASVYTASVEVAPMNAVTLSYEALVAFIEEAGTDVVNTVTADVSAPDVSFTLTDSETINVGLSAIMVPIVRKPVLDVVKNGDFEEGPTSDWMLDGAQIVDETQLPAPITPHSGSYVAWLTASMEDTPGLSQNVLLPNGYPQMYLQFSYWIDSTDTSCTRTFVTVPVPFPPPPFGGAPLPVIQLDLCTGTNTNGWATGCLPLTEYASAYPSATYSTHLDLAIYPPDGDDFDNDSSTNLFIDDVRIVESCTPTVPL